MELVVMVKMGIIYRILVRGTTLKTHTHTYNTVKDMRDEF
jgi:hypothetical protein